MKSQLRENEMKREELQDRLDEFTRKEVRMHNRLQEYEKDGVVAKQTSADLERKDKRLREQIQQLEDEVSDAQTKVGFWAILTVHNYRKQTLKLLEFY